VSALLNSLLDAQRLADCQRNAAELQSMADEIKARNAARNARPAPVAPVAPRVPRSDDYRPPYGMSCALCGDYAVAFLCRSCSQVEVH
jgi:hypothetical protein